MLQELHSYFLGALCAFIYIEKSGDLVRFYESLTDRLTLTHSATQLLRSTSGALATQSKHLKGRLDPPVSLSRKMITLPKSSSLAVARSVGSPREFVTNKPKT